MDLEQKKSELLRKQALQYHEQGRKGKLEVRPSKPCHTQHDLSLAYTPGVAEPCLRIHEDPSLARRYTAKGNLVAVISNGTAVLGLGDIGPLAGKPVMEGKAVLFKRFADVDVFDIELDSKNPDEIITIVKALAPTFGGINLEDIKAPECFYIEETLKEMLDIPVFHDDQHGTAIISGAAFINALELCHKKVDEVKVVFSGAGAAGIACANFYITLGVKPEHMLMTDSKGVLWKGRGDEGKNRYKDRFFRETTARTLHDALAGADVFCGVSVKDALSPEMIKDMAPNPIIFAMANPDPEIDYELAKQTRLDAIVATGRSDYANQVNNVLGFPFIFRGALDTEASCINEAMKMAAAQALATLAKEEVPDEVKKAYGDYNLSFGPEYIIPKPFDPRALIWVSTAVAEAAMNSGVAQKSINLDEYREQLMGKVDWTREMMRKIYILARKHPKKLVFPEGNDPKIIWAAAEIVREGFATPILLGKSKKEILELCDELHHDPDGFEIIEYDNWPHRDEYIQAYYKLRQRKGVTMNRAELDMRNPFYFGCMMVKQGHADGMVAGVTVNYPDVLRPALQTIGPKPGKRLVAGMYMLQYNEQYYFMADCAVNVSPTAEDLAEMAIMAAEQVRKLQFEPRIAMLSFSNFGSVKSPEVTKVTQAVEIVKKSHPDLNIDGPFQADVALDQEMINQYFPFSTLKNPNLLIFPNLDAGNIALKLLRKLSQVHDVGPIIFGLDKPIHLLTRDSEVTNIVNIAAIACVDAQIQEQGVQELPLSAKKYIFTL